MEILIHTNHRITIHNFDITLLLDLRYSDENCCWSLRKMQKDAAIHIFVTITNL